MSKLFIFLIVAPLAGAFFGVWLSEKQKRLDEETEVNLAKAKSLHSARKQND